MNNGWNNPMIVPGELTAPGHDGIIRQAQLSECGKYRIFLYRELMEPKYPFHPNLLAAFYMVNPSTADHRDDDQTIRKLYGFARLLGVSRFIVVNLCTLRTPNVKDLWNVREEVAIGPEADLAITYAMQSATYHVVGWGSLNKLPKGLQNRYNAVVAAAQVLGRTLFCFGTTMDGHPRHPCMTGYDVPRTVWTPPA
jgi:hypothetical protein